jgi:glycosyltransferase involved in cell wall biosynthesis
MAKPPLKVAINGQLLPGTSGGVESVLIGLVAALGRLTDGPEEYTVIGPQQDPEWLRPFLGPNERIVARPGPPQKLGPAEVFKRALGPARAPARRAWRKLFPARAAPSSAPQPPPIEGRPEMPASDGFYESLGCDLIHFPYQMFALCTLPSVFNPHDLQHRHFPQFFTIRELAWREMMYRGGCNLAQAVAVASQWVKQDLVRQYHISPDKIQVIPWAPPTAAFAEPSPETIERVRERYSLRRPFAFYPAMGWEHKNHLRLLQALALLRDRDGLRVNLVCTVSPASPFYARIRAACEESNLGGQAQFLGLVPREDLRALYRLAQFVVVPTLFEATSGPVFEAWQDRAPVACSTVTSLPEQAGDAALLFDPWSVESIADAVRRMSTEEPLRADLVRKGEARLKLFTWERTARAYRALYRKVAHQPLGDEDRLLLSRDWMSNPEVSAGFTSGSDPAPSEVR